MLTSFGIIVLILFVVCFFLSYKYSVSLLILLCVFSATGFMHVGDKFIQPYLIGSLYVVMRTIFLKHKKRTINAFILKLIKFALIALFVSFCNPILFDGITIYDKNLDYSWEKGGFPLHFGFNNITQMGYVLLNITTLGCISMNKEKIGNIVLKNSFCIAILIVVLLGYWEFLAKTIGFIQFPSSLFLNSGELYEATALDGMMRMSSVFGEASFCGAFLSAAFWGIVMLQPNNKWKFILLAFTGVAIILNLSGTGIISFISGCAIYFLMNKNKLRNFLFLLLLGAVFFMALHFIEYGDLILRMVFEKSSSESGTVRLASIENSWNVFLETYMLGSGLGSTRSSSFLFDMLAQVGLIGTILFGSIYYDLVKRTFTSRYGIYISFYLFILLVAQFTAIPDFSFSVFWLGLFLAAGYNVNEDKNIGRQYNGNNHTLLHKDKIHGTLTKDVYSKYMNTHE